MENDEPMGFRGGFWMKTRTVWGPAILVGVGIISAIRYPRVELAVFYSTSAQVIVTLYVAIAIEAMASSVTQKAAELTGKHWIYLVVSCGGLLAALRAISRQEVYPWLTGLTVAGLAATILLIVEKLINMRARQRWAWLWAVIFIVLVVVVLVI
ncbi:hypothetical protein [Amycolatopsis camponoti]|uniref:hypothetical protein n=1 Tax=Amycolatopsis camponoti TaxID=2606593 RepID=UPI0012D7E59F|nr:hypothetical protein [Amycolatopsis camponoti]